jgi:glycosyltransferase involved in cell wall biosynthesis
VTNPHTAPAADPLLSVVVLTHNEELNLPTCLASLKDLQCPIFVVDSGSVDRTREIARSYGATVVEHPFSTHALQWRWAFQHLPIATTWVLALDADQWITPELSRELRKLDDSFLAEYAGAYIKRQQWFRNRWIRHGGYYPKHLLKLFRLDRVTVDTADLVDHHFRVSGPVKKMHGDLVEENRKEDDIHFWIEKHNRYAALLAREEVRTCALGCSSVHVSKLFGDPDARTLAMKQAWRRMPLYVRPFMYFLYRYVVRRGFLDGKQGAIFHFMQALWFRLLVDINIDQLQRGRNSRT